MKASDNLYIFLISLISIAPFFLAEHFIGDFIAVPIIETISVFFMFIFLIKTCERSSEFTPVLFSFWYLLFKVAIMSIYLEIGSPLVFYNFILGFFWINFATRGIRNKDMMYWLLWLIIGICVNIIFSLMV